MAKEDFVGKRALEEAPPPPTMLRSIVFDAPEAVVLGKEPVSVGGTTVGYVTSAGYSATIGRSIAYAWLPADLGPGAEVEVDYMTTTFTAKVHAEPVVDPEMSRIRR
jgi:glycine cleavage system aminomethyltransferase T